MAGLESRISLPPGHCPPPEPPQTQGSFRTVLDQLGTALSQLSQQGDVLGSLIVLRVGVGFTQETHPGDSKGPFALGMSLPLGPRPRSSHPQLFLPYHSLHPCSAFTLTPTLLPGESSHLEEWTPLDPEPGGEQSECSQGLQEEAGHPEFPLPSRPPPPPHPGWAFCTPHISTLLPQLLSCSPYL